MARFILWAAQFFFEILNQVADLSSRVATDINVISEKPITAILMYDVTGKLIQVIECNSFQQTIDMNDLRAGMYSVSIYTEGNTLRNFKVIKE